MKKSVKAIAAAAAALTMALSCVSANVYAAKKETVPAVQAEQESSAAKYEFTEGKTVLVPYNGITLFADNDGTVYYQGCDSNNRVKIFTLNENGKIKNSYTIENDSGKEITGTAAELKQCGEDLYLIYSEYEYVGMSYFTQKMNNVIVKLDKELHEIARYNHEKSAHSIDTNGEKVVYLKGTTNSKIYICDIDGKNKKLLYSVNSKATPIEQPLNSVAIAGNYVGFQKTTGYQSESDQKAYCGLIDIETGEITLHEERSVQQVFSSNGRLIWYGEQGYYPDPEGTFNNISSDDLGGGSLTDYFESRYKYYDDGEIYVFDGENYSVVKVPDVKELTFVHIIDNEGNLITTNYKNGSQTYKIYHDGELMDELTLSYKGCGIAVANGGVLTFCYTGRDSTPDDWVGWGDSTPREEIEAMLAAQDERAAKIREQYPTKSVTFTYKH